jgi:hypothetical protein
VREAVQAAAEIISIQRTWCFGTRIAGKECGSKKNVEQRPMDGQSSVEQRLSVEKRGQSGASSKGGFDEPLVRAAEIRSPGCSPSAFVI